MAANDPLPGTFALPSLEQFQAAQRAQLAKPKQQGDGWNRLLQTSVFDLTRGPMGYKTPQERQLSNANAIMQDAISKAAVVSSDPLEQRRVALSDMVQRFNSLGYTELVAQAMPELTQLEQRQQEMRKLTAEADSAGSNARVNLATEGERVAKAYLDNASTAASTEGSIAGAEASRAKAARDRVETASASNEGQNYQSPDGKSFINVSKLDKGTRDALRSQGWVEVTTVNRDGATMGGKKEGEEFRSAAVDTANLINALGDIKQLAITQPGAWSVGGQIASKVEGIAQQVKNSLKQSGMTEADYQKAITTTKEGQTTQSLLAKANIADARQQAMVLNLAYVRAKALDPGGRLSNQDVEIAMKIVGGSNPQQQLALLEDILTSASRSFDTRAAVLGIPQDDPTRGEVQKALDRYGSIKPQASAPGTTPGGVSFRVVNP
jgi:hypothetical protein